MSINPLDEIAPYLAGEMWDRHAARVEAEDAA